MRNEKPMRLDESGKAAKSELRERRLKLYPDREPLGVPSGIS